MPRRPSPTPGPTQRLDRTGVRRIFIGDIQGCADELDDLLAMLGVDPQRDEILALGDLVNRGPNSLGVLRRLIDLGADSLLGNHDLHLLGCAAGVRRMRPGDTLAAVLAAPDRDDLLAWLRARSLVRAWDDVVAVHAGLHPHWSAPELVAQPLEAALRRGELPLADPDLRFLTSVRHCDREGNLPPDERLAPAGFAPWDEFYCGDRTVVFGHWAARGLVRRPRVRGLDSGCVWGGALSAWIAEEDRIVSVPARRVYRHFER